MMDPYWYKMGERREWRVWLVGYAIMTIGAIQGSIGLAFFGCLIAFTIAPLQHFRFKRMKELREDPLRCECGGTFVPPWDLGFDVPADHLICDNDKGLGPMGACTNFIITPPNYHTSCQKVIKGD